MPDVRRTKDGTRRIVTTPSQTFTVKLTKGEIEYLDWIEGKREAGAEANPCSATCAGSDE